MQLQAQVQDNRSGGVKHKRSQGRGEIYQAMSLGKTREGEKRVNFRENGRKRKMNGKIEVKRKK
jgi:hypothetical protein